MTNDFVIKPLELKNGAKIERLIESYSCRGIEDCARGQKLKVSFTAQVLGEEVLVTGRIRGTVVLDCFSCNEKFAFPLDASISQVFPAHTEEIDLEEEIRELLILNLPNKPLCRIDCRGLCPRCGKNLNAGTCSCEKQQPLNLNRLEKLKELLEKK